METKNRNEINRREFLKRLGMGTAAVSGLALAGCGAKGGASISGKGAQGEIPTDKMTLRTNHNTGDKVSILGYGCMRIPTMKDPSDPKSENEIIDQETWNGLIKTAMEHGVNYYDSSPMYMRGKSEEATGIALKPYPRDSYFVATKMSNFGVENMTPREAYDYSVNMFRKSLEYFNTDYIDYYLLHAIGGGMESYRKRFIDSGVLDFMLKEREKGHIRNLGFSFHGDTEVFDYLLSKHDEYKWDFVQIQMNYVDWEHGQPPVGAKYLYEELARRDIPVVIMEPLLGGRLSNVPDHVVARLKEREPENSVASWAFRFAGSYPAVLTVLSGMTYREHLEDNLRAYCPLKPLTDDEKKYLFDTANLIVDYPTLPCTNCKYCMPCPYGIDIPTIFAHYNKCVNEGNMPEGSGDPGYKEARRAFLVGYDRSVPRLRQANHCIGCGQCKPHCPQNINIPKELHRIDGFVEALKQGTV